jgi:hypothetical protein
MNNNDDGKLVVYSVLSLMWEDGVAGILNVYELVQKCRNSSYQIPENIEDELKKLNLLKSDGKVHDSIKDNVIGLVEGDSLEMRLISPVS